MEEKVETLQEDVEITDIGEVLNLTADENNPIGDGKEFKEEE